MNQPHHHRHPDENYSFIFKCLAAVTVTVAVIAVPLLIIPLLITFLFYTLFAHNQQPTAHVNIAREGSLFDGIGAFFRQTNHVHQHRWNSHQHQHHDHFHHGHGNGPWFSEQHASHHHGHG